MSSVTNPISDQLKAYDNASIKTLKSIGSEAVTNIKKQFDRAGIVSRSGNLRSHIEYEIVLEKDDMNVYIKDDMNYASYVNDGTTKMKARPFLFISPYMEEIIRRNLEEQINKAFK
jgi:hypothetical protein